MTASSSVNVLQELFEEGKLGRQPVNGNGKKKDISHINRTKAIWMTCVLGVSDSQKSSECSIYRGLLPMYPTPYAIGDLELCANPAQ